MIKIFKTLLLAVAIISSVAHAGRSALWQNIGPDGAHARKIITVPGNVNIVYVSVWGDVSNNNDELYRSDDGGDSWIATASIGAEREISHIAVNPADSAQLYLGLYNYSSGASSEILYSNDSGIKWHQADIEVGNITAIVADPDNVNIAYVSAYSTSQTLNIYQTLDAGASWQQVNQTSFDSDFYINELVIDATTGTLYGFGSPDVEFNLKSTDNGRTWTLINSPAMEGFWLTSIAIDRQNASTLYAVTRPSTAEIVYNTLYRSTDAGESWSVVSNSVPQARWGAPLIVHPSTPQTIDHPPYRSDNGGVSWYSLNTSADYYFAVDPLNTDRLYAAAGERGILRSDDGGGNWISANQGIRRSSVYQVLTDPVINGVLYMRNGIGTFKSMDSGKSWMRVDDHSPLSTNDFVIDPTNGSRIYAGRFRSEDGGQSWSEMDIPMSQVDDISIVRYTPEVLYASSAGGISRSNDYGLHWRSVGAIGLQPRERIAELKADPFNPETLYLKTFTCDLYIVCRDRDIYKSEDGGENWRSLEFTGSQLQLDPHIANSLYVVDSNKLHHSADGGESWQLFDTDWPSGNTHLVFDPNIADTFYLGSGDGFSNATGDRMIHIGSTIYRSQDGAGSWSALGANDTARGVIYSLASEASSGILYAGTWRSGLYKVLPDYPVIWWDQNRSGQGLSLWPRGDRLWGAWFLYNKNGEPIWLLFEGKPDNGLIIAPLLQFKGPALGAPWDTSQVTGAEVGQIDLDISNPQAPQLNAVVNGVNQSIDLDLSAFRPQADGSLSGVWWDPEQSGQGIMLSQQGDELWGVFHRYDESGSDTWVIFQGQFQGNILNTELLGFNGPALGASWNESLVLGNAVGQVSVEQQVADQLIFNYTLNGHSSVLNLQPF